LWNLCYHQHARARLKRRSRAGSTTDLIGRVLAAKMGDGLGQPVVVDDRPGAGANISPEAAAAPGI